MNDPNRTDHDRALLDDLEAEYLALVAAGDPAAVEYARAESDEYICAEQVVIEMLLKQAEPCAAVTGGCRAHLLNKLVDVAPLWAAREHAKRVKATEEMVAEWREEAAADKPEVFGGPRRPARRADPIRFDSGQASTGLRIGVIFAAPAEGAAA